MLLKQTNNEHTGLTMYCTTCVFIPLCLKIIIMLCEKVYSCRVTYRSLLSLRIRCITFARFNAKK